MTDQNSFCAIGCHYSCVACFQWELHYTALATVAWQVHHAAMSWSLLVLLQLTVLTCLLSICASETNSLRDSRCFLLFCQAPTSSRRCCCSIHACIHTYIHTHTHSYIHTYIPTTGRAERLRKICGRGIKSAGHYFGQRTESAEAWWAHHRFDSMSGKKTAEPGGNRRRRRNLQLTYSQTTCPTYIHACMHGCIHAYIHTYNTTCPYTTYSHLLFHTQLAPHQSFTISFPFPAFPMPSLPFFCCLLEEIDMWGYPVL